jgi:hypothetical protein
LARLKDVGTLPILPSLVLLSSSTTWQAFPNDSVDKRIAIAIISEPAAISH